MDIEGTYTLQAPPEDVWKCLMDQQTLRNATPGIEHLEATSENTYAVVINVKHAPLKGTYHGTITISEQQYPRQYNIDVEGEGRHGPISGSGVVKLEEHEQNTVVVYKGALHLDKNGTLLSAPLLKGAVKWFIQQFFLSLAEQLRALRPAPLLSEDGAPDVIVIEQERGQIAILPPTEAPQTFLHTFVHRVGLGAGDAAAEERWVRGIRRVSAALALLFLVWVGTRIPRK